MNRLLFILCLVLITLTNPSCKQYPILPDTGLVNFNITHWIDEQALLNDTITYHNKAGNDFSVSKLEYYVSNIVLIGKNQTTKPNDEVFYINPNKKNRSSFNLKDIPPGEYSGISFSIGLPIKHNTTGYLPNTLENLNMAWPQMMGGGYHFLKLEGHFIAENGYTLGYAMHIGTNNCLVPVELEKNFEVKYKNQNISLNMNINQWFENPNTYNLEDGNYIMGNAEKMLRIAENGSTTFYTTN